MSGIAIRSTSPEETKAIAKSLGQRLKGGEVFALKGDLGAGKTCFVQGLAEGLEVPDDVYVRSPTFALMDSYPGRLNIFHLDIYRLADIDELEAIGWRDCMDKGTIVAIEWAERIDGYLPDDRIEVRFEHHDDDSRTLSFHAMSDSLKWVESWAQEYTS